MRGSDEPHMRNDSHLQKLQARHCDRLREARKARANNRLRINGRFAKASLSGGQFPWRLPLWQPVGQLSSTTISTLLVTMTLVTSLTWRRTACRCLTVVTGPKLLVLVALSGSMSLATEADRPCLARFAAAGSNGPVLEVPLRQQGSDMLVEAVQQVQQPQPTGTAAAAVTANGNGMLPTAQGVHSGYAGGDCVMVAVDAEEQAAGQVAAAEQPASLAVARARNPVKEWPAAADEAPRQLAGQGPGLGATAGARQLQGLSALTVALGAMLQMACLDGVGAG
eukprot:gene8240-8430_t